MRTYVVTHYLKTLACYWDAAQAGVKPFEVRRDDRGFQRGDIVVLQKLAKDGRTLEARFVETPGVPLPPGERPFYELTRRITYVLTGGQFGIEPGYVVLGLEVAE